MLVYSDWERALCPRALLQALRLRLAELGTLPPGVQRHAAWVALLLEAGELAQALIDQRFHARGEDEASPLAERAQALVLHLAHRVAHSQASSFHGCLPGAAEEEHLRALEQEPLPEQATARLPEGFAFYALYPEAHAAAASALRGSSEPVLVLGIRSIGTTLASMVAAGLGHGHPPLTVRPVGPAFQRELALAEPLRARLRAHPGAFAIADEGPGLSGSSFGAVAQALEREGVAPGRLHFFPGHAGLPGPAASERLRGLWERTPRHTRSFESLFLSEPRSPLHLARWVEDVTGPAEAPLEYVGGGRWRAHVFGSPEEWPACHVQQERVKYLLRAGGRTWLLKFAGLGRHGEARLERARVLQQAGLIPPVAALRHGFICQPWLPAARPLPVAREVNRESLVHAVAEYLACLCWHLPAGREQAGASPAALLEMARHNAGLRLGAERASELERWRHWLGTLSSQVRRVQSDNRMHAWEWLVLERGRVLKADALDHHQAHDLVGCQDIAWDVAGACVELSLGPHEQAALLEQLARSTGRSVPPELLAFHLDCYLAFQLGHHALAAQALAAVDPEESRRLEQAACRYEALLGRRLETRPMESLESGLMLIQRYEGMLPAGPAPASR